MKKSINIISPSIQFGGGMERYICEMIDALAQQDYNITVYCLKFDKELFKQNNNVTVLRSKYIRRFPRFLKYIAFSLKVYFKTKKSNAINISAARIFNADIAIVGGTHKIHNEMMGKQQSLYDKIEIFLEKKMYQNAGAIIAHSELMVEEINAYQLGVEKKVKMIFPPVSQSAFSYIPPKQKAEYREKLNLPKDKYLLLGLGAEGPRKGIPKIVEALKLLDSDKYFLMIIGKSYNAPLPKNAKYYGLVHNVQDFYAAADITIAPSIYEPFGLITIESLEVGTPVIISKFLGSKCFVNEKNGLVLEDISPQAISSAIELASKLEFNCPSNFIQTSGLTWNKHIEKLELLF